MIDSHIHLDQYPEKQLDDFIKQWQEEGIEGVVAVSKNLASSYRTLEWKQKYPEFIHAAIGFHPEDELPNERDMMEWQTLVKQERSSLSAIGEIGLPYYSLKERGTSNLTPFVEALSFYLVTAKDAALPVALHAVHDGAKPALDLLQQHEVKQAHFHWLKAPQEVLKEIVASGYSISFTPELCYRKRDKDAALLVPMKQLLVETDGPWPFSDKFEGIETTPLLVKDVVQELARLKGLTVKEVERQTTRNALTLYGACRK